MTAPTLAPVPVTIPAELAEVPCYFAGRDHCAGTAVYWTRSHPAPLGVCEEALLCDPCYQIARRSFTDCLDQAWGGAVVCGRCTRFFASFDEFVQVVEL